MKYAVVSTQQGCVGFVASAKGVRHILMTSQSVSDTRRAFGERYGGASYDADLLPGFQKQLTDYFAGRPVRFKVAMDLTNVTAFQREVLEACATIDYGHTLTYSQLAALVGRPRAARAVGNAMARNPLPLVIPCHRVVAGNGKLGGFSAEQGVSLKKRLLAMEARSATSSGSHATERAIPGPRPRKTPQALCRLLIGY